MVPKRHRWKTWLRIKKRLLCRSKELVLDSIFSTCQNLTSVLFRKETEQPGFRFPSEAR
jgi:hypothetical protein